VTRSRRTAVVTAAAAAAATPAPSSGDRSSEPDDPNDPSCSADEYVKKQQSSAIGLQPRSTWKQEMYAVDPGLNQLLVSEGSTISQLFTQDDWERHRGVSRYWRHLGTTLKSTVFLRVLEPVLIITGAAVALAIWNTWISVAYALPALALNPITHTLSGSVLSLSLVFRTNNANRRVIDARSLLGQMTKSCRDMIRMAQYIPNEGGCREAVMKHLQAFPYALEAHVRKGRTRKSKKDPTAFRVDPIPGLSRALGEETARRLSQCENIPAQVLLDASTVMTRALSIGMSTQIHQQCEIILKELSQVISGCEKILFTPIPISYTRHTSRTIIIWLLTLPLALWDLMGMSMIPAIFMVTYLLLGVDEIGVEIEEPFCILPVRPICDMSEREIVGAMDQVLRAPDFKPKKKD